MTFKDHIISFVILLTSMALSFGVCAYLGIYEDFIFVPLLTVLYFLLTYVVFSFINRNKNEDSTPIYLPPKKRAELQHELNEARRKQLDTLIREHRVVMSNGIFNRAFYKTYH